jgi:hypothetical protein
LADVACQGCAVGGWIVDWIVKVVECGCIRLATTDTRVVWFRLTIIRGYEVVVLYTWIVVVLIWVC